MSATRYAHRAGTIFTKKKTGKPYGSPVGGCAGLDPLAVPEMPCALRLRHFDRCATPLAPFIRHWRRGQGGANDIRIMSATRYAHRAPAFYTF